MKPLRSKLFLVCLTLFILHQLLQKVLNLHYYLLDAYFDNLLAMPIILALWQAEKILLFKKGGDYKLSILEILAATIYVGIISEIVFPLLSTQFKSDVVDVLLYFVGSTIFYAVNRGSK